MRFAILILTHTDAGQTKRIVDCLNTSNFDFYIHLDKKVDMDSYKSLFNIPNVVFIKNRIDVKWGGYSAIEATLSGIRTIVDCGIAYDYIHLMSGQDYPIKSAQYITTFFSENKGREFLLYKKMDTEWTIAKSRVERYHFTDFEFKGKYLLEKMVNTFLPKRKFPIPMELFGKETYWSITLDCAVYVANFIDTHPKLRRFLQFTWGGDEFIFHSIILNSPFKNNVVNKNYRYMVWPAGSSRPKVLLTEDFEQLMATDALFARKFDIRIDGHVLDLIDDIIRL